MSGTMHSDPGEGQALGLVEACSEIFDGHDFAVVLGALTMLVTIALDDAGIPIEAFINALHGSQDKLASMRKERSKR